MSKDTIKKVVASAKTKEKKPSNSMPSRYDKLWSDHLAMHHAERSADADAVAYGLGESATPKQKPNVDSSSYIGAKTKPRETPSLLSTLATGVKDAVGIKSKPSPGPKNPDLEVKTVHRKDGEVLGKETTRVKIGDSAMKKHDADSLKSARERHPNNKVTLGEAKTTGIPKDESKKCWNKMKQIGLKLNKKGKSVPNCVKEK